MPSPTLQILTDWSTGVGALDIAPYLKSYTITRGRSSELDRVAPGTLTMVLDNPNGLFLPRNTSSSLSGSLIPGRAIQVVWTLSGCSFKRFTGQVVSYTPEPTVQGQREITIQCSDTMEEFQRNETRSVLYTDIQSGCLISNVLDNAGFPAASSGCRLLDGGQDNYPFAYFESRKIDEVLVDILRTEYGFGFIQGDGAYVFHDRNFRATHGTASATFNENMYHATFVRSVDDIHTEARVTTLPKVIKPTTTIWTLQSPVIVYSGQTASFFANYLDPTTCQLAIGAGVASPVIGASSDPSILFNSNASGTGTNLSASLSASMTIFAESFKMVASNGGTTTGYIWQMSVTGSPIVTYENVGRSWLDTAACQLYGLRTLVYDANLISDAEDGQAFAQYLVSRYSDPANVDRTTVSIMNGDDTNWEHILRRELDSAIAITCASLGLNSELMFVGRLNENYSAGTGIHDVTYTMETFGLSGNLFVIDVSAVNGTKQLGY